MGTLRGKTTLTANARETGSYRLLTKAPHEEARAGPPKLGAEKRGSISIIVVVIGQNLHGAMLYLTPHIGRKEVPSC